jgi:hypothetical protein
MECLAEPIVSISFCLARASRRFSRGRHYCRDPNTSAIVAVWICNECVARLAQVLAEESPGTGWLRGSQVWSRGGPMRA